MERGFNGFSRIFFNANYANWRVTQKKPSERSLGFLIFYTDYVICWWRL